MAERAHEAIFGGQGQARRHGVELEGGAENRLIGEAALAARDINGIAARARGYAVVVLDNVAGAEADIGHQRDARAQVEVIERVAHDAVAEGGAGGTHRGGEAEAGQRVDRVGAVAALDLGAHAVAVAPAEADDTDVAIVELGRAGTRGREAVVQVDIRFHQHVHADAGADIETGDGLRMGDDRQRQHRRGQKGLLEAHGWFSSKYVREHRSPNPCAAAVHPGGFTAPASRMGRCNIDKLTPIRCACRVVRSDLVYCVDPITLC